MLKLNSLARPITPSPTIDQSDEVKAERLTPAPADEPTLQKKSVEQSPAVGDTPSNHGPLVSVHNNTAQVNPQPISAQKDNGTSFVDKQIQALRDVGVSESHIQIALQRQAITHEPLTEIMRSAEYGFLTPEKVAKVHSIMNGFDYFAPRDEDQIPAEKIHLALQSKSIAIKHMDTLMPIDANGDELVLVTSEPRDITKATLNYPGFKHRFKVCSERTIQSIYRRFYAKSGEDAMALYHQLKSIKPDDEGADSILRDFILSLMRHGCYLGASDIMLSPMDSKSGGVVRYKIGGAGTIFTFLESAIWQRILLHIINMAGANESIKDGPVDTRWDWKDVDREKYKEIANRYQFRIAILQRRANESHGITIVMRILDQQADSSDLSALRFDPDTMDYLKEVSNRSTGLFLVTGPTGSGKTTTLYALLNEIDPVSRWIESIENPIEYSKGTWVQFQTKTGADEAEGAYKTLKGLLRAAPDVILFGEVRKGDIGHELVDAGNTGHLVFTTLHTNSAALAIARLDSFKLDMQALASLLLGVMAQRLLKTLCEHCKTPDTRPETMIALQSHQFLSRPGSKITPYRAVGCPECGYTGYKGRRMVYELLKTTQAVSRLIEQGAVPSAIAKEGINPEYTLMANALRLVASGLSSIEEAKKLGAVGEDQK